MSADNGFRYGTKDDTWPKGGEWVFVKGTHAKYDDIRRDQHKLDTIDNKLMTLEQKLVRAADFVRYLRALLLGGHVRKDKLALVSERATANDDPETVLAQMIEDAKTLAN